MIYEILSKGDKNLTISSAKFARTKKAVVELQKGMSVERFYVNVSLYSDTNYPFMVYSKCSPANIVTKCRVSPCIVQTSIQIFNNCREVKKITRFYPDHEQKLTSLIRIMNKN